MKKGATFILFFIMVSVFLSLHAQTWSLSTRLTWNSGHTICRKITVDSNKDLHVVWCDDSTGNREICYKKSTDRGSTWILGKQLTNNPGSSSSQEISVDSKDILHVIWKDYTHGSSEIYYKHTSQVALVTSKRKY